MPRADELRIFRRNAEWALVAATALELELVGSLAEKPASPLELADRLSLDPRGTETLLGALEALSIVRPEGGQFRLTGEGRAFLIDKDSPDYEADSLRHWLATIRRWAADLPAAVSGRRPQEENDGRSDRLSEEHIAAFMAAMDNKPAGLVESVCDALQSEAPSARTVLDLGGGPGTLARELARRGLSVTLLDRPEVVEHVAGSYGFDSDPGVRLIGGDFLNEIPAGDWDVVLLANITHIYGRDTNADLIKRAGTRLAESGTLAILDFVRGRSEFAALFAITMLLSTESGGTYGLPCYRAWLDAAGLCDVRCVTVSRDADLILGKRSTRETT